MTKAYSYLRFSSSEQLKGDSLRRQLEASANYATEHGLELDNSLRDLGVSAFRGKNRHEGALSDFLELVRKQEIEPGSYLLVESLDRLSREQILPALNLFLTIMDAGITIVTLADGQVYSRERLNQDFSPLVLSLTVMMRAHDESRMKSMRVAKAWENKRRNAGVQKLTARAPAWLKLANDRSYFELNKERVAIVQRIFSDATNGLGKRLIAKNLNHDSIPAFTGKRGWADSSVQKILNNEAVLGVFQPHKEVAGKRMPEGDPVPNYYPRIIEDDLFWRAKGSIKSRRRLGAGRKGISYSNLLSGIAICADCGQKMVFVDKGIRPKGGKYLVCGQSRRGLCENKIHFPYEPFETDLMTLIPSLNLEKIIGSKIENQETTAASVEAIEAKIRDSQSRLDNLVREFEVQPVAALSKRIQQIDAEIKTLEHERTTMLESQRISQSGTDVNTRYDKLLDMIEKLVLAQGTELLKLRAAIAQEFRAAIKCITFEREFARTIVELQTNTHTPAHMVFMGGHFHKFFVRLAKNDLREVDPLLISRNPKAESWLRSLLTSQVR